MANLTYQNRSVQTNQETVSQRQTGGKVLQDNRQSSNLKQLMSNEPTANNTGLPDNLKSGIENLSGMSMDNVRVHYNSAKPAQLNALAYAQGTDIHVASGQEKHLPHEAWHVVQQAQGRVKPTMQMKTGVNVNDDTGLEHEADVMGSKAFSTIGTTVKQSVQQINSGVSSLRVVQMNPDDEDNQELKQPTSRLSAFFSHLHLSFPFRRSTPVVSINTGGTSAGLSDSLPQSTEQQQAFFSRVALSRTSVVSTNTGGTSAGLSNSLPQSTEQQQQAFFSHLHLPSVVSTNTGATSAGLSNSLPQSTEQQKPKQKQKQKQKPKPKRTLDDGSEKILNHIFSAEQVQEIKNLYEYSLNIKFRALKHDEEGERALQIRTAEEGYEYLPSSAKRNGLTDEQMEKLAKSKRIKQALILHRINRSILYGVPKSKEQEDNIKTILTRLLKALQDKSGTEEYNDLQVKYAGARYILGRENDNGSWSELKDDNSVNHYDNVTAPVIEKNDVSISVAQNPAMAVAVALNALVSGAKDNEGVNMHDNLTQVTLFALNTEGLESFGGSKDTRDEQYERVPKNNPIKVNLLSPDDSLSYLGYIPREKDYEQLYTDKLPINTKWQADVDANKVFRFDSQRRYEAKPR